MSKKVYLMFPEPIGTVAPEIYGHFSEMIGGVFYDGLWVGKDSAVPNIDGWRLEAVEKLKKIHPPVLRWPGGCFAEAYNWRDGIGENRPKRVSWWTRYDNRYEANAVGTHEFCRLCELIGAKPYFAANVTSMTPLDIRDWMDYCLSPAGTTTLALEREKNGHREPFDVPFWGVGNENWGGGGNMTPETYAIELRRYAAVMSNIPGKYELIAGGANAADYNWTRKLVADQMTAGGGRMDAYSFHYYTGNGGEHDPMHFSLADWYRLLHTASRMETLINTHWHIIAGDEMTECGRLVIDEWGCWHPANTGPSNGYNLFEQQSTMRDAMVSALTLNIFNNHCEKIRMANVAQLTNNLHCLLLAGGNHCIVTPTYHVFDLFQGHMGGTAIRTAVTEQETNDGLPLLSVSASFKEETVTITLANLSAEHDAAVSLESVGASLCPDAEGRLLWHDDIHAHNTFEAPENVLPKAVKLRLDEPISVPRGGILAITVKKA